ncbi:MAG: hypothetical protein IPG45_05940 [Deltaproteobacteria bacterium]|nr:hypothetical protein [Deltaproteobacteria bacterium]
MSGVATTPVNALKDEIARLIESTSPPDRPTVRYHRLRRISEDSGLADRGFYFDQSRRLGLSSEGTSPDGASVSYVRWQINIRLMVDEAGRDMAGVEDAVNSEASRLMRRLERHTAWPTGVVEVIPGPIDFEFAEDSESTVVLFLLEALCAETDGN